MSMAQEGVDLKGVVSFHGALPAEKAEPGYFKAKVLILHGADDPLTTKEQIMAYQDSLRAGGADWQFMAYGETRQVLPIPMPIKQASRPWPIIKSRTGGPGN